MVEAVSKRMDEYCRKCDRDAADRIQALATLRVAEATADLLATQLRLAMLPVLAERRMTISWLYSAAERIQTDIEHLVQAISDQMWVETDE